MQNVELIGSIAGVLTTGAFFPQVVKTVRSRSTDDLSWSWAVMTLFGVALWLTYGIFIASISLVAANAVTFVCVALIAGVKLKNELQRKKRTGSGEDLK